MQKGGQVPVRMPEVPRRVLEAVRAATAVPRLELVEKAVSPTDGFAKYLFRGEDGEPFEAVRIPLDQPPAQVMKLIERCDAVLLPGSKGRRLVPPATSTPGT